MSKIKGLNRRYHIVDGMEWYGEETTPKFTIRDALQAVALIAAYAAFTIALLLVVK